MTKHILFDLDNTLYSIRHGLEDNVHNLIEEYIIPRLDLPPDECIRQWKDRGKKYGTTIEWLIFEKKFTAIDEYHHYVHPENEADALQPDPDLRSFLMNLPCPCSVLTNSPRFHADRIISKLGIENIFQNIFDIHYIEFKSKPSAFGYLKVLNALGLKPEEVLFVDDIARYVQGYIDIGGRGILLDELDRDIDFPHTRIKSIYELKRYL